MELAFNAKHLRTICESEDDAKKELGETVAEVLKRRLADLRAAVSVMDLVAGHPRTLDGDESDHMILNLRDGYFIVFAANHVNNPTKESGQLDWASVTRIKILRIERNNG